MTPEEAQVLVAQIGTGNLAAISGGRVVLAGGALDLPAGAGYHVRITLDPTDTYTVRRIYVRNGVQHEHGTRTDVYAENISEVAYRAACYASYTDEEW